MTQPIEKDADGALDSHRRRAATDPARRDGARRRRRRPRERRRPHARGRVGDAGSDQLHVALGARARVHAVRRRAASTSSRSARWCRPARPGATPRSRSRSTTATRGAASARPTARSRSAGCSTRRRGPTHFVRPGHVFPLRARDGGVLERRGHTEAAVDLARLAGLAPVAVICEVLHDDGSPARFPYLEMFARGAPHRDDLGRAARRVPRAQASTRRRTSRPPAAAATLEAATRSAAPTGWPSIDLVEVLREAEAGAAVARPLRHALGDARHELLAFGCRAAVAQRDEVQHPARDLVGVVAGRRGGAQRRCGTGRRPSTSSSIVASWMCSYSPSRSTMPPMRSAAVA